MTRIHAALLAMTLAAPAWAQGGPSALHAAWLRETLDLDLKGACKAYLALARDEKAPLLERQVAAARLEELRRIGAPAVGAETAPEALPPGLQRTQDPDTTASLQRAVAAALAAPTRTQGGEGAAPSGNVVATQPVLPSLRPLVQFVVQASRENTRDTRPGTPRLPQFGAPDQTRVVERVRAYEIARAEVAGRTTEADEIRLRAFPNWRAQPWPEDKAAAWKVVRNNLLQLQQERQINGDEREVLERLLTVLDADAQTSTEAALARIDRLPIYAERLRIGIGS